MRRKFISFYRNPQVQRCMFDSSQARNPQWFGLESKNPPLLGGYLCQFKTRKGCSGTVLQVQAEAGAMFLVFA